jgi:endonuclease/exonuclease/phosphatase (EEP) superfamily protein YafD
VRRVVSGSVTLVVSVLGLASVIGLLDRVSWVFEGADVFRLQYAAVLLACALVAAGLRRRTLALAALALVALNIAVIGISLTPSAAAAPASARGTLRVVVANVEVGNTDFAAVGRLVARTHPAVLGVTELTPSMAKHLRQELPRYDVRVVRARTDAYGIGVFSRVPLHSARIVDYPASDGPPSVVVGVDLAGRPVTVVVTHVHTPFAGSVHARQLDALARARPRLGSRLVVCGDFNSPPWTGPLRSFASDAGLRDLYGRRAWAGYSWPTWSPALRVPIDNCFVSGGVAVRDYRDGPDVGSDHRPLVVDFALAS